MAQRSVPHETSTQALQPAALSNVLCGVDGSRAGREAARQAAIVVDPGGVLRLVSVSDLRGSGPSAQASLSPARAESALAAAAEVAREAGAGDLRIETEFAAAPEVERTLLDKSAGSDLLVVGISGGSRAGGAVLGRVATGAAHRATVPLLVARPTAQGEPFPERIVLATDGSADAHRACTFALALARRHRSRVTIVTVGAADEGDRHKRVAAEAADLFRGAGVEPVMLSFAGEPRARIVEAAATQPASLVIVGSRGRRGLRALGSVSEHVLHHVPCSVLVARPPAR